MASQGDGEFRRTRVRRDRVVLEAGFRDRGPERVEPGRLGAATWGMAGARPRPGSSPAER